MPRQEAGKAPKLFFFLFFSFFFFINAAERKKQVESWGLSGVDVVLTVNTVKVPTLTGARYNTSEEMNYTGTSPVRNSSLTTQP